MRYYSLALLGFGSLAVADEPVKGSVTLTDTQMAIIVGGGGLSGTVGMAFVCVIQVI